MVEPVVFRLPVPDVQESAFDILFHSVEVDVFRTRQFEVVNPDGAVMAIGAHFVGQFRYGLKPHVAQNRHNVGERHRRCAVINLQVHFARGHALQAVEIDADILAGFQHLLQMADVMHGIADMNGFMIGGSKSAAEGKGQLRPFGAAMGCDQNLFQALIPLAAQLNQLRFDIALVIAGIGAVFEQNREQQTRQRAVVERGEIVHHLAAIAVF